MDTLRDLFAGADAASPAILTLDRPVLDYGGLEEVVADTALALQSFGIASQDRVAMVLPNGPEMASCFVAVASYCASAPLNPAYKAEELDFYLDDLDARLLIVAEGIDGPARGVAERRGIAVAELVTDVSAPAGAFSLRGPEGTSVDAATARGDDVGSEAADVGLILHTSGTTSRPKMVPLTQRNLYASAGHIAASLALEPGDRCLNVMPLFHIHGLMAAVLATLSSGASVFCSPGFNALRFFSWLDASEATWYTAVPTMHQSILDRAARNPDVLERHRLRFLRSSSASLPPQVMQRLEETFRAPVIEAYGMTEAAHQMASNPLPPLLRKPGSVGPSAGPEMAIMNEAGDLLPRGEIGEVVIRGPNVTAGYLANPEANAAGFSDGWFRTGDQGRIDEEGYLTLTGRLKEIINRGGEKISPREVDEILMDHEAVAQVVTFALPHPRLGEEVAAAVVLEDGAEIDEKTLRGFAGERLAPFKVPAKVVFLDEIPKGATGKLQRSGLATKLGLDSGE